MTRRPVELTADTSGIYGWLLHREQAAQAGQPVTVFAGCLPRRARPQGRVGPCLYATIAADGGITFRDDPAQFVVDNGI